MAHGATVLATVADFLSEIGREKTASDPGSIGGSTSHPSKSVDDSTQAGSTGARASENEKDIKEMPVAKTVDSIPEGQSDAGKQDQFQLNIGTNQSATGEDPSVEDDYKGEKDDPGTSHPAEAGGEKYGSDFSKMSNEKLASVVTELGNELLADISTGRFEMKQASAPAPKQSTPPATAPAVERVKAAAEAGHDLAATVGQAIDNDVAAILGAWVKQAHASADSTADFLDALRKQATDETDEGEDHDKPGDEGSGSNPDEGGESKGESSESSSAPESSPAQAPAGPGGPPAAEPAADPVAAMLGGGGGPDPAAMMGGGGASPDAGAMMGMAAGPAPAPEAAMGQEDVMQQLAAVLMEMGISPEELISMLQGSKMAAAEQAQVKRAAENVSKYRRSGKFAFSEAKTAREKDMRNQMRAYIAEIASR